MNRGDKFMHSVRTRLVTLITIMSLNFEQIKEDILGKINVNTIKNCNNPDFKCIILSP